jgi:dipicolinate synthase subunit A
VQGRALLPAKRLEQLVEKAAPGGWVLGGMFREQEKALFQQHGLMIDAYAERESFARRNAIPTAEGALQRILEQTPYTIQGSTAFVLGFGRVGTALSLRLTGLGAMVFVWDSDLEAIRRAKGYGLPICSPEQLPELLPRCDLVVNTVPAQVLTESQLSRIHREALLLDLASAPGGVSKEIVQSLSFCYFWATSLPPGMLG